MTAPSPHALQETLTALAAELEVPGVAAAVVHDGRVDYAFTGVTSVENPLPVDETTLFQFGSTGKTYTATAILRLVEQGLVDLDAPVRTYVPELRLADTDVADRVTVLQLLNHTAGWDGDLILDTGNGDDALEKYVVAMADIAQVTPLGATVSYNNASLSLAGRLIEKVTGKTYEQALTDLVLSPLGMNDTLAFPVDIMVRRFVVGHHRHDDGRITIARPWSVPRSANPAGGWSATAADQVRWAQFHLGDGTAADGTRVLSADLLARMKRPTVDMKGSALGDAVGISWLLRDLAGVTVVGHGGTTNGQHSEFTMVPERGFAVIVMTNSGPNGPELNTKLGAWAMEHYLGLTAPEPGFLALGDDALAAFAGSYETIAVRLEITVSNGRLLAAITPKPDATADAVGAPDDDETQPPLPLALIADPMPSGDPFTVPDGPAKGMRGYFTRGSDGSVSGVHIGGRLAERIA